MKVVVTGSSGRIGRAIVARLLHTHDVIGYDQSPASVTHIVADLNDEKALLRSMQGADAVIHTASLHAPHVPYASPADFEYVNVTGTEHILECCAASNIKNIVYTSTTALYGTASTPDHRAGWITEQTVPEPVTIYHRTKLAAEALLENASNRGMNITVLRMSRCFPEPAPIMAGYRLHRGVDARDVAQAHELAMLSNNKGYRVFVISGATPFFIDDVYDLKTAAEMVIHKRAPVLVSDFAARGWRLPASIERVYSSEKAQVELSWKPRFGYKEVLKQYDDDSPEVLPPLANWNAKE